VGATLPRTADDRHRVAKQNEAKTQYSTHP